MMWKLIEYDFDGVLNWSALEERFSWIQDMKRVPQDERWHAEGNVFIHTRMVVEALVAFVDFRELTEQNKHILLAAALMHDIEKRSTTSIEIVDGVEHISSHRHAKRGEHTVRSILYKEFEVPFAIREHIAMLVRLHSLPIWAIEKNDPGKAVIGASLVVDTKLLSLLARADILGRICDDQVQIMLKIDLFDELCKEHKCFGEPRGFASDLGRYNYLNKPGVMPDFEPYDDCEFNVTVMCALPGSGKDTYISNNLDVPVLSLDDIRREYNLSPTDKRDNGKVVQIGKEQAKQLMRKKQSFVFNATNVTADLRNKWITLFMKYGARVKIIYLEVPYKTMLKQNRGRLHEVPKQVIENLIDKLDVPRYGEAHEVEYVVTDK